MTLIRLTSIHDIALRPVAIQQHFFVPCHIYKILRSLIHTDERCYGLIGVNACSFTSRSFLIYILFFTKKTQMNQKKQGYAGFCLVRAAILVSKDMAL